MLVTNSVIGSSMLDMNSQPITSVADPIHPQDAATRYYVDSSIQRIESELQSLFSRLSVELKGTEFSNVANIRPGSYIVTVIPYEDGYPTASFSISKASAFSTGHVMRMTAGLGLETPEQLEIQWPQGGNLMLRKTGPGYDGSYFVDLNVKNISTLPSQPVLPSDQASKAYVDKVIRDALEVRFGGVKVQLQGIAFYDVINLRLGSYVVAVTPIGMVGGPTATFSISKNNFDNDAAITKMTEYPGMYTFEQLEMAWPANKMLQLRKSGLGYDGQYLVDMNLKNFGPVVDEPVPAPSPSTSVTDLYGKGVSIMLSGSDFVPVIAVSPGSYVLTVSSVIAGGPTATFSLSKSVLDMQPSVVRITGSRGADGNEDLEIAWPPNQKIQVRKTGDNYDGMYVVETSLRNITLFPENYDNVETSFGGATKMGRILQYDFALYGQNETRIAYVDPGIYFAFLTSKEPGIYNATFSLNKMTMLPTGCTIPMVTSGRFLGGDSTVWSPDTSRTSATFDMILRWGDDNMLYAKKSVDDNDGVYMMKLV
jgi:hypothetical protein